VDLLLSRILSGYTKFSYGGAVYGLASPSLLDRHLAEEFGQDIYMDCLEEGLYTQDDVLQLACEVGVWDDTKELELKDLSRQLDDFRVRLSQILFKSNERQVIKLAIATARERIETLGKQRGTYGHLSAENTSSYLKYKFLVARTLRLRGKKLFKSQEKYLDCDSNVVEEALSFKLANTPSEEQLRKMARSEFWRQLWAAQKDASKIFGMPAAQLSDEQRNLVIISIMYDSVYSHPNCPPDIIVEDDDSLDGWFIVQRRKRESEANKAAAESQLSGKVRNADSIFIPANTWDDVNKIYDLNEEGARQIVKKRQNAIKSQGHVHELYMPDTHQRLQMEINKKFRDGMKS
jgi:hypothetical protein